MEVSKSYFKHVKKENPIHPLKRETNIISPRMVNFYLANNLQLNIEIKIKNNTET